MSLIVIGINHKTAPVEVREKFSFTGRFLDACLMDFKDSDFVEGAVILSTCNRAEIYFDLKDTCLNKADKAKSFMLGAFGAKESDAERYFYLHQEAAALKHLFRVACGLDSQVLGENQILGQVKSARLIAKEKGGLNDDLDFVFKKAQDVGLLARRQTLISRGNVSIGSIAVKMLKDRFGSLDGRTTLIVGAGKMGILVSKYLKKENVKGIFIANRTYEHALKLAADCGGRAADFKQFEDELKKADIVISSTSSPHIILRREALKKVLRQRNRPLFIMDLAVPRDVEPDARDISGVFLYDLDDLKCVVDENHKNRLKQAAVAERLVEQETEKFAQVCESI